jgi:hypothetical protein
MLDMAGKRPGTLVEASVPLGPWEVVQWQLELCRGDHVRGIVTEKNDNWLRVYLMDELNYANKKNGGEFQYWGMEHMAAFAFDHIIPKNGTFYLIIEHDDWWGNREIAQVKLRKSRS